MLDGSFCLTAPQLLRLSRHRRKSSFGQTPVFIQCSLSVETSSTDLRLQALGLASLGQMLPCLLTTPCSGWIRRSSTSTQAVCSRSPAPLRSMSLATLTLINLQRLLLPSTRITMRLLGSTQVLTVKTSTNTSHMILVSKCGRLAPLTE